MHGAPIMELIRFKLQLLNAYSEGKKETVYKTLRK